MSSTNKKCPFRFNNDSNVMLPCDNECALFNSIQLGCSLTEINSDIKDLSKKVDELSDVIFNLPIPEVD
jgi:hypothetical protein